MAITERDRHEAMRRIEEVLGELTATVIMELLPPVGWADVATRRDTDALGLRFDAVDERFEAVHHRFDAIDHRFDAIDHRFEALEHRFDAIDHRFDAVGAQIAAAAADIRTEVHRAQKTLLATVFGANVAVIGVVAALVGGV